MQKKQNISRVEVKFLGGIGNQERSLTGSCSMLVITYVDGSQKRIIIDVGLYQGKGSQFNETLDFNPGEIDAVILTHGHSDHIGRLPLLFKGKTQFTGSIYTTSITKKITSLSLADSAKIYELAYEKEKRLYDKRVEDLKDARRIMVRHEKPGVKRSRGGNRVEKSHENNHELLKTAQKILFESRVTCDADIYTKVTRPEPPLFTKADVDLAVRSITPFEIGHQKTIIEGVKIEFCNAGHIAGSIGVLLRVRMNSKKTKTLFFSGDIGSYKRPFFPFGQPETPHTPLDLLVMETTYGGKVRDDYVEGLAEFEASVIKASEKKSKLIIPCFALDRAQIVLFYLCKMKAEGRISCPIYLDSPLSDEYTKIYGKHAIPGTIGEYMKSGEKTFNILTSETREQALLGKKFAIILTSSGMATGGGTMYYLEHYLSDSKVSFYFMGYMSEGTLGRELAIDQLKLVSLPELKTPIEVNARVKQFTFLSGHADEIDLWKYFKACQVRKTGKVFLIHGERTRSTLSFLHFLKRREVKTDDRVLIPDIGEMFEV